MSIPTLTYEEACAYLFPRVGDGRRWSLGPTRTLLRALGNPQTDYAIVHVGGTNGKGSVATLIYEALQSRGDRVGIYTSPHLVDATERIVVSGRPISRDAFAAWTTRLQPEIEATGASHFEAVTAIALADFAARHVDIAVVEVGLGGRLDSTNVVDPVVAVVTNVGPDHAEYLGSDLNRVAWEKASIAKPGVPLVIGEEEPTVLDALVSRATELGGRPHIVPTGSRYEGPLALRGSHQRRNAMVAWEALEVLPAHFAVAEEAVRNAFGRATVPGRFDWRGKWILDVAHNQPGIDALCDTLVQSQPPRPIHAVVAALNDKPLDAMVKALSAVIDRTWLTVPPSAPPKRVTGISELEDIAARNGAELEPDFDRALQAVLPEAQTVVVTGSFYTVGDAMSRLPGFTPFG